MKEEFREILAIHDEEAEAYVRIVALENKVEELTNKVNDLIESLSYYGSLRQEIKDEVMGQVYAQRYRSIGQ